MIVFYLKKNFTNLHLNTKAIDLTKSQSLSPFSVGSWKKVMNQHFTYFSYFVKTNIVHF
jgi:hypothetical protein